MMDKQELVRQLEDVVETWGTELAPSANRVLTNAIAYIQSTPSRDEVLKVVNAAQALLDDVRARYPDEKLRCPYMHGLAVALGEYRGTTPAPQLYERAMKVGLANERGNVEDRRKSAYGKSSHPQNLRRSMGDNFKNNTGRRAGDRARWTGEKVETFVPKDANTQAQIAAVMLATGTPEQQAEVLAHITTPQPEKPSLVEPSPNSMYGWVLTSKRTDDLPDWLGAFAAHIDYVMQWHLAMLDARLGSKQP